jgi:hypothetical protein
MRLRARGRRQRGQELRPARVRHRGRGRRGERQRQHEDREGAHAPIIAHW